MRKTAQAKGSKCYPFTFVSPALQLTSSSSEPVLINDNPKNKSGRGTGPAKYGKSFLGLAKCATSKRAFPAKCEEIAQQKRSSVWQGVKGDAMKDHKHWLGTFAS